MVKYLNKWYNKRCAKAVAIHVSRILNCWIVNRLLTKYVKNGKKYITWWAYPLLCLTLKIKDRSHYYDQKSQPWPVRGPKRRLVWKNKIYIRDLAVRNSFISIKSYFYFISTHFMKNRTIICNSNNVLVSCFGECRFV